MKKLITISITIGVTALLGYAGSASATIFGDNITIYDNDGYYGSGVGYEDEETEPGMVNSQAWDLEGFYLDGTKLTVVGGFDFIKGVDGYDGDGNDPDYTSGDLFFDTTGDVTYGVDGNNIVNGYDIVLDLDFSSSTFNAYNLTTGSGSLIDVASFNSLGSSPWKYEPGTNEETLLTGDFEYFDFNNLDYSPLGLLGGSHNAFTIDIGSLSLGTKFTSHFTMGCGNDNLMGQSAPVPEPATMLLFGTGLVGLAGAYRKKKK